METRENILATALRMFNEQGSSLVTTNHIAKEAGISPGSLYYHFKNKEEIILALFEQMISALSDSFQLPDSASFGLNEFLEMFQTSFKLILQYPFFSKEINTLMRRDSKLKKVFHQFRDQRFQDVEMILAHLVDSGQMRLSDQDILLGDLVEMVWVLAFFWTPYLEMSEQPLDEDNVERGVRVVLKLLEPYFIPTNE